MPKPAPIPNHRTPNYRQVRHEIETPASRFARAFLGETARKEVFYTWQPVPLRASRKDLQSA